MTYFLQTPQLHKAHTASVASNNYFTDARPQIAAMRHKLPSQVWTGVKLPSWTFCLSAILCCNSFVPFVFAISVISNAPFRVTKQMKSSHCARDPGFCQSWLIKKRTKSAKFSTYSECLVYTEGGVSLLELCLRLVSHRFHKWAGLEGGQETWGENWLGSSEWLGGRGGRGGWGGRGGVATLGTGLPGEVTLLLSPPKAESYDAADTVEPYFHQVDGKRRQKNGHSSPHL